MILRPRAMSPCTEKMLLSNMGYLFKLYKCYKMPSFSPSIYILQYLSIDPEYPNKLGNKLYLN